MIDADRMEFVLLLNGLAAIKPGKGLTPEGLELWWLSLQDWSIEEFRSACAHLSYSVEFMPSPYHFAQLRKAGRATAGEAFARALAHVRTGGYRHDNPLDALTENVIRALGGWRALAITTEDRLPFVERRFCEHYESMMNTEDVRVALPHVAGDEIAFRVPKLSAR